jgi:uncharacterized repeat protein (TIGR01451 family)
VGKEEKTMRQQKRRWGLLAFVAVGLVVVALLSLASSAWATPDQDANHGTVTIPPIKTVDKPVVLVGDEAVFEVELTNSPGDMWTWSDVVVTDTIDSRLAIRGLMTSQGSIGVDGQDVTVNVGDLPPGDTATITIYVSVTGGDPGDVIENRAYALKPGYDPLGSTPARMTIGLPAYVPLVFKAYSAP